MGKGLIKVERDGWFIDIETLDVSSRPHWEIRCLIRRKKQDRSEERRHRLYVSSEVSERLGLDELAESRREERLGKAAKAVILRELEEILAEPEGGLDSLKPLTERDLQPLCARRGGPPPHHGGSGARSGLM
jgi:hypothetical protein